MLPSPRMPSVLPYSIAVGGASQSAVRMRRSFGRDLAHEGQQQGQTKLGNGRVAAGCAGARHERDALFGGRFGVDIGADAAGLGDQLQVFGMADDARGHWRALAVQDGDGGAAQAFDDLVLVRPPGTWYRTTSPRARKRLSAVTLG